MQGQERAKGGPMQIASKEAEMSGPQPQGTGFGQHPEEVCKWILPLESQYEMQAC